MKTFLLLLLTAGVLAGDHSPYLIRRGLDSPPMKTTIDPRWGHLYSPGEPRPVSFSVECRTAHVCRWIRDSTVASYDSIICDTTWNYPVEYEAVVKYDTVGYRRFYLDDYGKTYLKDNQDVNAIIYREPIIHCDTLGYRRVK